MTYSRIADLEKDHREELETAEKWLRKNEKKLPKGELARERVLDAEGRPVARVVSLPPQAEGWHTVYAEREGGRSATTFHRDGGTRHNAEGSLRNSKSRFVPLQGRPQVIDLREAMLSSVVRKVLDDLSKKHQDILQAHYLEGRSLKRLIKHGESRQGVANRLRWARVAFMRAWLKRTEEPIVLKMEDF